MKVFRAKTVEGYSLKILAELLQQTLKVASFTLSKTGITLQMMDEKETVLYDINLDSTKFNIYTYKFPEDSKCIGINLKHLHEMLKNVKKRDTVELSIDDDSDNDLCIQIIPKEANRVTTGFVKIQPYQSREIELPDGYEIDVLVQSAEFQKMCKGLARISETVNIESKGSIIKFSSNAGGVMGRCTEFGEISDDRNSENEYNEEFDTSQIVKISKISGFGKNIQISAGDPLLFKSDISSIGNISIYIKSNSMVQDEVKKGHRN